MNESRPLEATLSGVALCARRSNPNLRLFEASPTCGRWALRVLVFLICGFGASRSFAAEGTQTYRDALLRALVAKDKALDSDTAENWAETLRLLRTADAIQTVAVTKYEIALAAAELGQTDVAVENYEAGLNLGLPEKASDRARDYIVSHVSQLAQLQIDGPAETQILLRGVVRARLPRSQFINVAPGSVELEALFPDGRHAQQTLLLTAGRISKIVVTADDSESTTAISKGATEMANKPMSAADSDRPHTIPWLVAPAASNNRSLPNATTAAHRRSPVPSSPGWALVASGTTAAILSAAFIPITYARLSTSRDALRNACAVQTGGSDGCDHSKRGRRDEAQSASNSIATWKMARTVSWAGLFAGLAVTLGGSTLLVSSKHPAVPALTSVLISAGTQQVQISYATPLW